VIDWLLFSKSAKPPDPCDPEQDKRLERGLRHRKLIVLGFCLLIVVCVSLLVLFQSNEKRRSCGTFKMFKVYFPKGIDFKK